MITVHSRARSLTRSEGLAYGVGLSLVLLALSAGSPHAQGFTSAFLDRSTFGDNASSMVVRNVSTPTMHLAYFYGSSSTAPLRYATRTGTGAWAIDSSLTTEAQAGEASLAVVNSSPYAPHLALTNLNSSASWVTYATKSGSTWSYETVLPVKPAGTGADSVESVLSVAIALSSANVPTVAYCWKRRLGKWELWVATRQGANNWSREKVVVSTGSTDSYGAVNLKMDTSGNLYVVWARTRPSVISAEFAKKSAGTWSFETIASGSLGQHVAMALDGTVAHAAYDSAGQLYWAVRDPSLGWQKTSLRPMGSTGGARTIALTGTAAAPLIAYQGDVDSVRFASKTILGWNFQRVAQTTLSPALSLGFYASGGANRPQIAYSATGATGVANYVASGTQFTNNDSRAHPAGDPDAGWIQDGHLPSIAFSGREAIAPGGRLLRFGVTLSAPTELSVELLDLAGRRIAGADLGHQGAGRLELSLPLEHEAASGIYFLTARNHDGASAHAKVALIR